MSQNLNRSSSTAKAEHVRLANSESGVQLNGTSRHSESPTEQVAESFEVVTTSGRILGTFACPVTAKEFLDASDDGDLMVRVSDGHVMAHLRLHKRGRR